MKRTRKERDADFERLRSLVDGDDRFFGSHQIKKMRTRTRETPAWANSDKAVRKILLAAFSNKWGTNRYRRVLIWTGIINHYFRLGLPASRVAAQLRSSGFQMKTKDVENTIASIRRVARGHRADNGGLRGLRPPGRPNNHKGNSNQKID